MRQPRLSETLAREAPGLVGIEEEPSQLWFCPHRVAVLDAVLGERWDITPAGCRLRQSELLWRVLKRNPSGLSTTWSAPAHATTGHRCNPFVTRLPLGRVAPPIRPPTQSTFGSTPRTVSSTASRCLQHLPTGRRPGRFSLAPTKRYNSYSAEGIVSDHVHWQL